MTSQDRNGASGGILKKKTEWNGILGIATVSLSV